VVRGLKGNRTGLIIRLHHCMADGIAGVGIMNALLDTSPEAPRLPKKRSSSTSRRRATHWPRLRPGSWTRIPIS